MSHARLQYNIHLKIETIFFFLCLVGYSCFIQRSIECHLNLWNFHLQDMANPMDNLEVSYHLLINSRFWVNGLSMYIQVTRDGSHSDLSKFLITQSKTAVPFFNSIKLSKFTPYFSNFQSLKVLYLLNQDLGPVTHISLFFTLHLEKSGRLCTLVSQACYRTCSAWAC